MSFYCQLDINSSKRGIKSGAKSIFIPVPEMKIMEWHTFVQAYHLSLDLFGAIRKGLSIDGYSLNVCKFSLDRSGKILLGNMARSNRFSLQLANEKIAKN